MPTQSDGRELPDLAQLLDSTWYPSPLPERVVESRDVGPGVRASVVLGARSAASEKVRLLNLKASDLKTSDIHAAVRCLQAAQALALETGETGFDARWWLRLPTFLQLAGRMDDAERAFDEFERDLGEKKPRRFLAISAQARAAYRRALAEARRIARERDSRLAAKSGKRV